MILRRCDRYLLRQMVGPFFLALAGLALFIVLNLILRLSELMVDRGIAASQLIRLLLLWMPELIAWAIPMAALFAVFLGLGRMEHDREVMALESIGVSLRRLLLPLLIAACALSLVTFAVYNYAMPASKFAAQRTYREILFSQSMPRISVNTFFTGSRDQYYYVRQYDADTGVVRDVLIYDVSGQLFPQADARITLLSAETGRWEDETWTLSSGRVYGFSQQGVLTYSSTFDELALPVGLTADQMWAQAKSPSEMSIPELRDRIQRARASGISVSESRVELHQRFALPLSALLFVLVGGTVSLMFGSKNRSTGIIVGLLIIGLYQGTYFWMQAIGRRGALDPALAAWIPNVLFGILGLLLFLRVDRLASRDTWSRLRGRLPFLVGLLFCLASCSVGAQPLPLQVRCDRITLSSDGTEILAEGSVVMDWEGLRIASSFAHLLQLSEGLWELTARGQVEADGDDFQLGGDRVSAMVGVQDGQIRVQRLDSEGFRGQFGFENSQNELHRLYFQGTSGHVEFDDDGSVSRVEVRDGMITTCDQCDRDLASQPYSIRSSRLLLYPDRMIVAFGLTGRLAGVAAVWLPVYVQPLEETVASPLFPAVGKDALRGWFFKWNVPYFLSESLYGSVFFDVFTRYREIAGGLQLESETARQRTRLHLYAFPAVVGDDILQLTADHRLTLSPNWAANASLDYDRTGATSSLAYSGLLEGQLSAWSFSAGAQRSWKEEGDVITQQLPDVSLIGPSTDVGTVTVRPRLQAGWVQEWREGVLASQAGRWRASLSGSIAALQLGTAAISPSFSADVVRYSTADARTRGSVALDVPLRCEALSLTYQGTFVSGASPFLFDQLRSRSHAGWSLQVSDPIRVEIGSGVDLLTGSLDPLVARAEWGQTVQLRATLTYDLERASAQEISVRVDASSGDERALLEMTYDAAERRWKPIPFEISRRTDRLAASISGSLDGGTVQALRASGTLETDRGWGAGITVQYAGSNPSSLRVSQYQLFYDVADCLRIGLERREGAVWVYGSILAFPEAVLRYAPRSVRVQFGT